VPAPNTAAPKSEPPVVPSVPPPVSQAQQPSVSQNVPSSSSVDSESLQALVNMGFPETECRAALKAAKG
jgi:Holliday junction resolvasome RuvABC DNA-binding subunit